MFNIIYIDDYLVSQIFKYIVILYFIFYIRKLNYIIYKRHIGSNYEQISINLIMFSHFRLNGFVQFNVPSVTNYLRYY